MPPKKQKKDRRPILPGQQAITGFFQKPKKNLTGGLLSCYGVDVVRQPFRLASESQTKLYPRLIRNSKATVELETGNSKPVCSSSIESLCHVRKRCLGSPVHTSSPLNKQTVKQQRTVTSSTQTGRSNCRAKLFPYEESEANCKLPSNKVTKKGNPFALVKDSVPQSGGDALQHGNKRQSVLDLQQPMCGLDDSLDDSGLFKLYLGEQLDVASVSQQQEVCEIEMELEEDLPEVGGDLESSGEKNGEQTHHTDCHSLSTAKQETDCSVTHSQLATEADSLCHILDGVEFTPLKSQSHCVDDSTSHLETHTLGATAKWPCVRCLVKSVSTRRLNGCSSLYHGLQELVLELEGVEGSGNVTCLLRDDWIGTEVSIGDQVHIVGTFSQSCNPWILDNTTDGFIIVHPDTLIQGTRVAGATHCMRRTVLDPLFQNGNLASEATLFGTLAHQVFDEAMKKRNFSDSFLDSVAKSVVRKLKHLDLMFSLGITEELVLVKISELLPALQQWADTFVCQTSCSEKEGTNVKSSNSGGVAPISISELHDIEENIWSPHLGLKGKIDATVEVKIHKRHPALPDSSFKSIESLGDSVDYLLLPLELKTGKMMSKLGSVDHRAQVILYTLLLSDRHDVDIPTGLLLYLKAGHMTAVPSPLNEQRALIMKRNELAGYFTTHLTSGSQQLDLPPVMPAANRHYCLRCPQLANCMLHHRAVEGGSSISCGVGDKFDELVGHFSENELTYFRDWYWMVSLESRAQSRKSQKHKLWTRTPDRRKRHGTCFSAMQLMFVKSAGPTVDTFVHTFYLTTEETEDKFSLLDQNVSKGDLVVVSRQSTVTDRLELAVATGFLLTVEERQCTVSLDKELKPHIKFIYHIDKEESASTFATSFSNLARLFVGQDTTCSQRLRRLIIDLKPPCFITQKCDRLQIALECAQSLRTSCSSVDCFPTDLKDILSSLNSDQLLAVEKVLSAADYALILGMPGTGKTTTIACIVRILVKCGKRVLLTSYTHSVVDNVLIKLQKAGVDFLRVGNPDKVHPAVQPRTVCRLTTGVETVAELKDVYLSTPVVATTCLGVNQTCFTPLHFDYCIVDEASQITQPVCLGPLHYADVFLLVGDHNQLPPLVQSVEARNAGMDVSLFKRLSDRYPDAVAYLKHQYRMNRDIMLLSNSLIYDHHLKCASAQVANEALQLSHWNQWKEEMQRDRANLTWLSSAVDPSNAVVFLDTDMLDAGEVRSHGSFSNVSEAKFILLLILEFLKAGLDASNIGVISPYRSQLKTIRTTFSSKQQEHLDDVEVDTVDKFQGRDKSCVLVSMVRSNKDRNVGGLLTDWRRVNVTLTRAKHKLILIGSCQTLSQCPLLKSLLDVLTAQKWVVSLPKDCLSDPELTHI